MMPMGWGMGGWYGFMLFFLALIVVGAVLVIRWALEQPGRGHRPSGGESALDILKRRYARGEVDKEEFERMKADLR